MWIDRIQIPHHGNNNNYDFQLMNEAGLCQFAFCCQDDRDKMQGTIRNVCNDLGGIAKVMVHVVDENGESEIVQEIKDTEEKHFFPRLKFLKGKL